MIRYAFYKMYSMEVELRKHWAKTPSCINLLTSEKIHEPIHFNEDPDIWPALTKNELQLISIDLLAKYHFIITKHIPKKKRAVPPPTSAQLLSLEKYILCPLKSKDQPNT